MKRRLMVSGVAVLLILWTGAAAAQEADSTVAAACVDLNSAPTTQLQRIVHIGAVRAQEIVRLRQIEAFPSVASLTRVSGIAREDADTQSSSSRRVQDADPAARGRGGNVDDSPPDDAPGVQAGGGCAKERAQAVQRRACGGRGGRQRTGARRRLAGR